MKLLSVFAFLIMVIKVFHYSNFAFAKSNLMAKKGHSVVFTLFYDVTKLEFFCNTKDRTPKLYEYFIVYEFICPGCNVTPTMLAKLKEFYMKDVLNMPGMTKIALGLTILMNV